MPGRTNTKFTRIYINEITSDLFLIILQVMICTGVSVSFIIGTVITWRALALSGNLMIKHANKKEEDLIATRKLLETWLN